MAPQGQRNPADRFEGEHHPIRLPERHEVGRGPRLTLFHLGEPEKAIGRNEPQIELWFASFGQNNNVCEVSGVALCIATSRFCPPPDPAQIYLGLTVSASVQKRTMHLTIAFIERIARSPARRLRGEYLTRGSLQSARRLGRRATARCRVRCSGRLCQTPGTWIAGPPDRAIAQENTPNSPLQPSQKAQQRSFRPLA